MTLVNGKNGKELFKFAADLQYKELENAVIDGNKELIKTLASDLLQKQRAGEGMASG